MKKNFLLLAVGIILVCISCDKISKPYVKQDNSVSNEVEFPSLDLSQIKRKILIEEFTGQQCPNCVTQGHVPLAALLESDTSLIPIAIHAGGFAIPTSDYPNDFRTELGNKLNAQFVTGGIPCALINRVKYDGAYAIKSNKWEEALSLIDRSRVPLALQIVNQWKDDNLIVNTKTTILGDCEHKLVLVIVLTEDNIIGPQLSGSQRIDEYVHQHVLRASVNGIEGCYLSETGIVEKDSSYLKSYELNFNKTSWKKENCKIVTYIFDAETFEILQAESRPVCIR
ncbi:MAG: Omp28-related outer membrane protein [Bacteroidales bacterium]|nr:Omp28-related outer membrane protein [Bacteroidales bacterium]